MIHRIGEMIYELVSSRQSLTVTMCDVTSVLNDSNLRAFLLSHFTENTKGPVLRRKTERGIVFMMSHLRQGSSSWSPQSILRTAAEIGFPIAQHAEDEMLAVQRALKDLTAANLVRPTEEGYALSIPMLGSAVRKGYPDLKSAMQYA
jgi:hypothetical protein